MGLIEFDLGFYICNEKNEMGYHLLVDIDAELFGDLG
jgi:hypothetical protein